MTVTAVAPERSAPRELSLPRLGLMRAGYAFMAIGLALAKWPLLLEAHTLPLAEGLNLSLLTGMFLLALLGLRHPVKLLPLLVFETAWKLVWLSIVALPQAITGDLSNATAEMVFSCSLVVLIIAAIPWRYVWSEYVRSDGDRWRS